MLLWAILPILTPVTGQFAAASKSVISPHPPWTTLFQGETVNLMCYGLNIYLPQQTKWYYGGQLSRKTQGNTLKVKNSGEYRCQTGDSLQSNPVHLDFSRAPLILQAPVSVFEGDLVLLKCKARPKTALDNITLYKNNEPLSLLNQNSEFLIHGASLKDNGQYHCTGSMKTSGSCVFSNTIKIQVQDLFPRPVLTVKPSQAVDGISVILTCETQLPPQKLDVQLQYCFFRKSKAQWPTCSSSPQLQISALWTEESDFYWCKAESVTSGIWKESPKSQILVRGVVANIQIHTVPALESVFEGQGLVLICSVKGVPGRIKFSWYKRDKQHKWGKVYEASEAEFKISTLRNSHAGEYHCEASNSRRHFASKPVIIKVKVPVSRPVLTLSSADTQAFEGHMATLLCEVQRGSPRIVYQFYHEDVPLGSGSTISGERAAFSFSLTAEHSGKYYCTANNGLGAQRSEAVSLMVTVPVSHPVLTLRGPRAQAVVGDVVQLQCEALRGSPPILYQFYHEDIILGNNLASSGGGASFNLTLTAEHSGNYHCDANNGQGAQRSDTMALNVTVPVSRPVLTLRTPRDQTVVGDIGELHCEALRGSPPIWYLFYHKDINLVSSLSTSGGGASFTFFLTTEHSGNYSCEAKNILGAQRSEVVTIKVTVPVSRPILTLKTPRAQAVVGDMVELHCEALRGSPPILYQFYHENFTLGNSSALCGGGVSFNLSLTAEHSGNYSCDASNGLWAQHSERVTLFITGLAEDRRGPIATGVTGGLLSMAGLAAGALLVYCWLSRKAGGRPAYDPSRRPSDSCLQEPTYHNIPSWIELQPVYSNVNPRGGDVVYSEVRRTQKESKPTAASEPKVPANKDSSVIYSQVKMVSGSASKPQQLASSAPHR